MYITRWGLAIRLFVQLLGISLFFAPSHERTFIFVKDLMIMRKQRLATQAYTGASSSMDFPSLEGYSKIVLAFAYLDPGWNRMTETKLKGKYFFCKHMI